MVNREVLVGGGSEFDQMTSRLLDIVSYVLIGIIKRLLRMLEGKASHVTRIWK